MQKKIGFIGAGNMGSRMANRLLAAGHEIFICDANPSTIASYQERGVAGSSVPADTARSDIIILMVPDDEQLLNAVSGEHGILSAVDPSAPPLLLIMSTALPKTMITVRDRVSSMGVRTVEAPVSGGVGGAERGTLSIMMGGEADDIEEVMPVVRAMGQKVFICGPYGSAQTVKLINNMIGVTNLFIGAEAFTLASKAGLDFKLLGEVLEASTGRNYLSQDIKTSCFQYANWASSPDAFSALLRIVKKDMQLALILADDVGIDAPVSKVMAKALTENEEASYERWHSLGELEFEDM